MDDNIYQEKYSQFINSSHYYKASMHKKHCKICKLPRTIRNKIDSMLLSGNDPRVVASYLNSEFPNIFEKSNTASTIKGHKEYLPHLIEDVMIKTIFKRARHIVENKDISKLSDEEKAKMITDIEDVIIKEYSDLENERVSLLNVLFKETLPLLLERMHRTIVDGKTREIKEIADASNVVFKMTTAISSAMGTIGKDEEEEKIDFSKFERSKGDDKEKVLSLTDKIKKATSG